MKTPLRVLMVEDSEDDVLLVIRELQRRGYEPDYQRVQTSDAMRATLLEKSWDVILCDYKLPQFSGPAAIALLKETGIDIPLIIVSGAIGEETATDCMRLGAHDYVMKGNLSRLVPAIERERKEAESRAQRRRSDAEAIQARSDWEHIFQAISHPTVILDPQHRIMAANKAVACGSGLSQAEIIGRKCYEVFHGRDAASPPKGCPMESLLASGRTETVNDEMEAFGGTYLVSCTPVRNGGNQVEKIIHIVTDITPLKRTEEALREGEERYRSLFQNASVGIFHSLPEGRFLRVNLALARIMGYGSPEEMISTITNIRTQIYVDSKRHPELVATTLENAGWTYTENRYRRKDGTILTANLAVRRVLNADGAVAYLEGFIEDISERKQAMEALEESEKRFREMFDDAPIGYHELDAEGRVARVNQIELAMLGYSAEEMLGRHVWEFVGEKEIARRAVLDKLAGNLPPVRDLERNYRRKDGTLVPVLIQDLLIRETDGKIAGIRTTMQDITERKQADQKLKDTLERLRKAVSATIQAMASTVETRDPYTAGHQNRVADLARTIATEMNLSADQIDGIRMAAAIHDLGKISVPAEILSKPTKISALEFGLIKTHAQSGYDILKDIDFPWPIARIVLEHHERMDGSGYPNGLCAEEILLESRILAVADVVESIASHRPYRPALGMDAALEEIEKNSGTLYDNTVVDVCLKIFRENRYQF